MSRFVVVGAGAIGGTVAATLRLAGRDVVVVARGAHLAAIRDHGLRLRTPGDDVTVPLEAVGHPADLDWRPDDVVLLATKSQQTAAALDDLVASAPAGTPVACLQNGVSNEPAVLRRFAHVQGVCVMTPAAHLEPGVVACYAAPAHGILDLGRYPSGVDETSELLADAFRAAGFGSNALADIRRPKYSKLLDNLGNAVEALCPPGPDADDLAGAVRSEGEAILGAAGIDWGEGDPSVSHRRDGIYALTPIDGERRTGGSTWQSLARATGDIEVDHLNGEIVLQARLRDLRAPLNEALQQAAVEAARSGRPPGSVPAASIVDAAQR